MNQPSTPTTDAYIPGVCNINTVEIAQRRKAGYLGLVIYVVMFAVLLALPINRYVRVILILPAILSAIGFLQAKNRFCVGYAGAGMQNASEGSTTAAQIEAKEAVAKDKQRARQINLQAVAIGVVAGLIAVALPVFNQ